MKLIYKVWLLLLIFGLGFSLNSCVSIPQKELDAAEKAIRESEKVNANKYAADELQEAKEYLTTAKNQVKDEKNKEAKTSAIQAKEKGDEAYFKALSEFVKSQNEGTRISMEEAKASHADILVPDKYNEAEQLYNEVQKDLQKVNILSEKLKSQQSVEVQ